MVSQTLSLSPSQVTQQKPDEAPDIEDFGVPQRPLQPAILISIKRKRASQGEDSQTESQELELTQSWREILGLPPPRGTSQVLQKVGLIHMKYFFSRCSPPAPAQCRCAK